MSKYRDIRQELWRSSFESALGYDAYLEASEDVHAGKWRSMAEKITVPEECASLVAGFERKMNVLVYSGVWCGDCVRQGPMFEKLAQGNDRIDVRFAERVDDAPLGEELRINGAQKVPVVVFLSEDGKVLQRTEWSGSGAKGRYKMTIRIKPHSIDPASTQLAIGYPSGLRILPVDLTFNNVRIRDVPERPKK